MKRNGVVFVVLVVASVAFAYAQSGMLWIRGSPWNGANVIPELFPERLTGNDLAYAFYFTRVAYSGRRHDVGEIAWTVDYPKADEQFLMGLTRLVGVDAYPREHPLWLTDPDLSRFPFLHLVEPGYLSLLSGEADSLRRYLLAGGFLVVDDFWGTEEWANFEREINFVLPEYPIAEIPLDHPVFHAVYDIREVVQVPNIALGRDSVSGGLTHEKDGLIPHVRGIFDQKGRLMVLISWNSDLGDAWEWAENPEYPLKFSTYTYQMGVNIIVYAMSH